MRVGLVGCGLVGLRRARALGESKLVACADIISISFGDAGRFKAN